MSMEPAVWCAGNKISSDLQRRPAKHIGKFSECCLAFIRSISTKSMHECKICHNNTCITRECHECKNEGCEQCAFWCANCGIWFCSKCRVKKACAKCGDWLCSEHTKQSCSITICKHGIVTNSGLSTYSPESVTVPELTKG